MTDFVPRSPGAYRATVVAKADDGTEVGQRETGWTSEPATDEFRKLAPNRELMKRIAEKTGGEIVEIGELDSFVENLPTDKVPVVESRVSPIWHDWRILFFAVAMLVGEWGVRRWKGLP